MKTRDAGCPKCHMEELASLPCFAHYGWHAITLPTRSVQSAQRRSIGSCIHAAPIIQSSIEKQTALHGSLCPNIQCFLKRALISCGWPTVLSQFIDGGSRSDHQFDIRKSLSFPPQELMFHDSTFVLMREPSSGILILGRTKNTHSDVLLFSVVGSLFHPTTYMVSMRSCSISVSG